MNEFLEQFLTEARELVEQATSDLLALEGTPLDRENLDGAFRAFHTLKGGAGIVDFAAMSRAMHAAEDILSSVREGDRPVTPALIGDCLACLDQVVQWLDAIEDNGDLPLEAQSDADRIVARFAADDTQATTVGLPIENVSINPLAALAVLNEQLLLLTISGGEGAEGRMASAGRLSANLLRHMGRADAAEQVEQALLESARSGDATHLTRAIEKGAQQIEEADSGEANAPVAPRADPLSRTLRVDSERVNALVNLTGELTVAKNAVGHIAKLAQEQDSSLAAAIADEHARLDRLIGTLQHAVLALRVLPVRVVFQRFSRLAREMSASLAKPVRLATSGDDTEADKAIVEMLFEPLLHVVRNAMDHGIESGPERVAAGKPAVGIIHLRARRESEHVIVEVEDDGRGIDPARIRAVAAERGLAASDVLSSISDEEALNLIFAPGFSTAVEISGLSGRGVGMDAVRRAVERLGGRVFLETRVGKGSTVRFVLPFSVMITRVITVEAGGQMFGIPLEAVVETVRVRREQIHAVGGAHVFVLRDKMIPLIELGRTLGRGEGRTCAEATVVVALSGGQLAGLEVDRLGERLDAILKPPDGLLSGMLGIAGTTLLGNGSVLLVLDLQEVLR